MDTSGEIEISELRDGVSDTSADADVNGERVEIKDNDAEGLSERVAIDEELPFIDREIEFVNVAIVVKDKVLILESDTIEVTVTTFEDDDSGDIDRIAEEDWLTRKLDETEIDASIVCVIVGVADNAAELDVREELLEVAVGLTLRTLENDSNGEAVTALDLVINE